MGKKIALIVVLGSAILLAAFLIVRGVEELNVPLTGPQHSTPTATSTSSPSLVPTVITAEPSATEEPTAIPTASTFENAVQTTFALPTATQEWMLATATPAQEEWILSTATPDESWSFATAEWALATATP